MVAACNSEKDPAMTETYQGECFCGSVKIEAVGACCHLHILRSPEAESVYRTAGPGSARSAVAVTHGLRRADSLELH